MKKFTSHIIINQCIYYYLIIYYLKIKMYIFKIIEEY